MILVCSILLHAYLMTIKHEVYCLLTVFFGGQWSRDVIGYLTRPLVKP